MKKIIFCLIVLGQYAFAQDNNIQQDSTKTEQNLEEVIVTANRAASKRSEIPVSVSKLSPKTISETKPTSIYEVINKTPGVLMVSLGNEQHAMAIRQPMSYTSYFLYLEDGIPIRPLGVFNHNALLEINQFSLHSIEVVKGPVSSIYGPEAVGGTINFISQNASKNPMFRIGLQSDQFGYRRMQVSGGSTIGKLGFYVSGLTSDQTNSWLEASDYTKNNINLRIDYKIDSNTKLTGTFMKGKYYSETSSNINEQAYASRAYSSTTNFTYRNSDALRTRITLDKKWNENSESFATIFYRDNKLGQNPAYGIRWRPGTDKGNNPNKATGEVNSNNFKSYGVLAQHSEKFDNFLNSNLIVGGLFDYSPNDYFSNQLSLKANLNPDGLSVNTYENLGENGVRLANYDAKIINTAGYLQYSFNVIEKLKFTLGTRYDQMALDYNNNIDASAGSKEYNRLTSKVGLNYNLKNNIGFYGNFAQGFAPPGLSAIFRKRPGTGTDKIPADFYYNLKSASFNNYELGGFTGLLNNNLFIDYAIYYMEGKNELLNIRQPDGSTDFQSAGKTSHQGIEFGLTYKPNAQWIIRTGGTTAKHEFIDFQISTNPKDPIQKLDGFEMPQAPRWVSNSEVMYYPKWLPNLRTALEFQYVSNYFIDQINTVKYEGYNFLNARLGYNYKGVEFYTNMMNITNKLYAFNVSKGINPTDVATYNVAAPRTFMFGIEYNLNL
jgi:iron complex outermembrane recepter protein